MGESTATPETAGKEEGTTEAPSNEETSEKVVKLTQAELDNLIAGRTAQARKQANEAKEAAKKWEEYQRSQQTEQERAETKRQEAEQAAAKRMQAADQRLRAAEIRLAATEKGARKESLDLIVKLLAGEESISVDDDGKVSGASEAIDSLMKDHAYLKAGDEQKGKSGAEFTGNKTKTLDQKIEEAYAAGNGKLARVLKLQKYEGK